jgi:hypothetical protein
MSFPQSRETQRASRGCAPGTPAGGGGRSVALHSRLAAAHSTLPPEPTASGGWRNRTGRTALGVCYPSLRTPCGRPPAGGRPLR